MKRFSRLDHALKLLRRPVDINDPTATAPAAPAGSALAEYEKFVGRKKFINLTRTTDSLPGSLIEVTIMPFGFADAPASRTQVSYSRRSSLLVATYGGVATFNHEATNDGIRRAGFVPAKATIFDPAGTTTTPKTSQITAIPYKKRTGKSYTIPFGRGAGADEATEFACRATVATAIQGARPNASVSFKSEELRSR
jgi:hypothetical protein